VCDAALDRLPGSYNGLIFASVNGVKGLFQRLHERGMDAARLQGLSVYAVGPATAKELRQRRMEISFMPEQHTAAALAEHLLRENLEGRHLLFPRGDLGSDELPLALGKAGARVDCVEVYRTVAPDMTGAEPVLRRIFQGEIDVVAFASPSAAKNFAGLLPEKGLAELSTRTTLAAIGPSTLEMIRTLGGTGGIVATNSTAAGLAAAIAEHSGDHE
jgi:uroporphyrinogen III methyltransferase/synthase